MTFWAPSTLEHLAANPEFPLTQPLGLNLGQPEDQTSSSSSQTHCLGPALDLLFQSFSVQGSPDPGGGSRKMLVVVEGARERAPGLHLIEGHQECLGVLGLTRMAWLPRGKVSRALRAEG